MYSFYMNFDYFIEQIARLRLAISQLTSNPTKLDNLYNTAKSLLNKHLTLDNSVPASVGCAQAMSYLLKKCGYHIPDYGISSTVVMYDWLTRYFVEISSPQPGAAIIAVTGTGVAGSRGHVGIVGKESIMSNNSDNGLWMAHWTLPAWIQHYQNDLKMKVHFFIPR